MDRILHGIEKTAERITSIIPRRLMWISEKSLLVVLCVFLTLYGFLNTKLDITYPPHPAVLLMPFAVVAMLLRLLTCAMDYKRVIWGLIAVAACCISFILNRREFGNYGYLVLLGFIIAGCIGIRYDKLLKIWCFTIGSVIAITFIAASIGAARNLVYYAGGWRLQIRGSLGVVFPTDCAAWVLFFIMFLWVAYQGISDWFMILIAVISAVFSLRYCNSNTSFICSLLFVIMIIYRALEERFFEAGRYYSVVKRITNVFIIMLFPFFAAVMFLLSFLYSRGSGLAYSLDEKLHHRIALSRRAFAEYGITLFGTNFEMRGAGGGLVYDREKYNFLDSSYVNILIRYGIVVFFMVMAIWFFIGYRAIQTKNRRLLFIMALIAVHSFEEHHFIDAIYNPLIMLALSDFGYPVKENVMGITIPLSHDTGRADSRSIDFGKSITRWLSRNTGILSGILVAAAVTFFLPQIFSIMRTVADLTSDSDGKPDMLISLLMIVTFLLAFCAIECGVIKATGNHFNKRDAISGNIDLLNRVRPGLIFIFPGCILAVALLLCCELVINTGRPSQSKRIESERAALEHIFAVNSYPVYSDVFPEIYRTEFPEFSQSVFSGEDLARYHRATVLLDSSIESNCFFSRGYLFTKISDYTGVYTNDEDVLNELQNAGYHITGYYNVPHKADADGKGRFVTEELFGGRYLFTADMEITSAAGDINEQIGEIRVDAYEDSNSQGAEPLYLSDFKDGKARKDITCNIWAATPEATVIVDCIEGYEVNLTSVSYNLMPDVDTHNHYNDKYQIIRSEYYDLDGNRIAWSDGASALEFEYDDSGNQNIIRYYGIDDKPQIIGGGYAEIHKVYDDLHRVIAESYYGVDGKPKTLQSGQASDERELDVKGNIVIQKYYGLDGRPIIINSGYSEVHRKFDDENRCTLEEYYGPDGNPITLIDGYAAMERVYDENGNAVLTKYLSSDGRPTIVSSGYSEIHRKFDEMGRTTEESYYGEDGKLMSITSGYAMIRWDYDSVGRVIKESYYGTDEKPTALNSGQASDTREYDSYGNCVVQKFFAEDGRPVLIDYGCAEVHRSFNDKNQLIEEFYYGTGGEAVTLKSGQAATAYGYDDYGNQIMESYMDANGKPMLINSGIACIQRYYDDRKRLYREEYRDTEGQLTLNTSGYCAVEKEFDEADRVIRERWLDVNGNDVMTTSGYSVIENDYDKDGRLTVRKYTDVTGEPSADKNTMITEVHYTYDSKGRIMKEEYYGADGLPAENNAGYSIMENTYDDIGSVASHKFYDTKGNVAASNAGYAEIRYEYDATGRIRSEWYYDSEGNPVTCIEGYYGIKREYNEKGLVSAQTFVDKGGMSVCSMSKYAIIQTDYDDHGRVSAVRYYDVDGELTRINAGYAVLHREYDKWGRTVRETYYDEEGKSVLNSSRIASYSKEYDNRDLVTQEKYYDESGAVSENSSGISEVHREYNDINYLVKEEQSNTTGTRQEVSGYAAILYEYDDHGLNSVVTYVDKNDAPVLLDSGYSKMEYTYDELRNRIGEMYTDVEGRYVKNTSGYAGIIRKYAGRICVEESFLDTAGKPVNSAAGYCTLHREYDKDRNLIKVTYLDNTGKPVINNNVGYAEVRYEYDDMRNRIGDYYYDASGKPVTSSNGYKLIKTSYDKNREVLGRYRR